MKFIIDLSMNKRMEAQLLARMHYCFNDRCCNVGGNDAINK